MSTWTPDPAELARARTELIAAEFSVEIAANRITVGADTQLRLDRRGRWHPLPDLSRAPYLLQPALRGKDLPIQ